MMCINGWNYDDKRVLKAWIVAISLLSKEKYLLGHMINKSSNLRYELDSKMFICKSYVT